MHNRAFVILLIALIVLPLTFFGCKGKVEKPSEEPITTPIEEVEGMPVIEPAQLVATETIPPTAAPEVVMKPQALPSESTGRNREIQTSRIALGIY